MKLKKALLLFTSALLPFGLLIFFILVYIKSPDSIQPSPIQQQRQLFVVGETQSDKPISVRANTLPQFAFRMSGEKFKNLWTAHAAEREGLVKGSVTNAKGDISLKVDAQFNEKNKQLIVTPKTENRFKPGLYMLDIKVKTYTGEDITVTQDFTWGVLAINTNKGFYMKGDDVNIGMAVLDDYGITKCIAKDGKIVFGTAKLWLTITSPSGSKEEFSTDEGSVTGSKTCADRSFTNIPDFLAHTKAFETGRYTIHIKAENYLGTNEMDSFFNVRDYAPYVIERVQYPMRIYPRFNYPVKIKVTANRDFSGSVFDTVPSNFQIFDISDSGSSSEYGKIKAIEWQVDWKKGESHILSYTIKFPYISPEFYLIGPLKVGEFSEGQEWQIASDSIFSLVQEAHNTATTET